MARKWILNDNEIRMGNVGYHRELKEKNSHVHGGGFFEFVEEDTVLFFGESQDFGQITEEQFIGSYVRLGIKLKGLKIHFTTLLSEQKAKEQFLKGETILHKGT